MNLVATKGVFAVAVLLAVSAGHAVFADTWQGTFTFQKRVPSLAFVYFPEDTGLSPDMQTVIDQKNKQFSQKVMVTTKGAKVVFKNSDSVDHNISAYDKKSGIELDTGLMKPGSEFVHKVEWEDTLVGCVCKIHPTMKMWIASISSKYYKVLEFGGGRKSFAFEITDISDNLSKVTVLMPGYDPLEVSIGRGGSQEVAFKRRGKIYGSVTLARK